MTKRMYLVATLPKLLDEKNIEYSDVVNWSYDNLDHSQVLILTEGDVMSLRDAGLLDIINQENDSMIDIGEDDWIISQKIKKRILTKLEENFHIKDAKIQKLIDIFHIAIKEHKNIYFLF